MDDPADAPATIDDFGRALDREGRTFAVAESLTGGALSSRFAAAGDSASWYRGAVVSYSRAVKHLVLHVPKGPVVSETAATAMAEGVCRVLDADVGLSVTGAGGPEPQDGQPPGTVWMATHDRGTGMTLAREVRFDGDPTDVVESTCDEAVRWLLQQHRDPAATSPAT